MMDTIIVRIPKGLEVEEETYAIIMSDGEDGAMTARNIGELSNENVREVMCRLNYKRVERIFV